MADISVATDASQEAEDNPKGVVGPYWISPLVGVTVYINGAGGISFARTTNGNTSKTVAVTITSATRQMSCWFDQETPGDTGTLLHITWLDSTPTDACYYQSYDIDTDSLGTLRTVDNVITVDTNQNLNRMGICKTRSSNLVLPFSTQSEARCYRSTDGGATWDSRNTPIESATQEDLFLLFPADTGDPDDACCLFWDRSATEISIKMYDESGNSWTETTGVAMAAIDGINMGLDGVIRHGDGHLLWCVHSDDDTPGDDLLTGEITVDSIASPTLTARTNVFTNQGESARCGIFINQQNDDVYISYVKGGTWQSLCDIVYHISTDGMVSWGAEQAYSEAAADDVRTCQSGRTAGNSGGNYQPSFFNDDTLNIYINRVNQVQFAAVVSTQHAILNSFNF